MAKGAQCAEDGPFFATTPRVVIQNGIAISRDIVIMPDWVLIGAMLGSFALLMIILVIGLVSYSFSQDYTGTCGMSQKLRSVFKSKGSSI